MSKSNKKNKVIKNDGKSIWHNIVYIVLFIIVLVLIIIFVPILIVFFLPILLGGIIAIVANPLVTYIGKKTKLKRRPIALIITILTTVLLLLILYVIINYIYNEALLIVHDLPSIINQINELLSILESTIKELGSNMPFGTNNSFSIPKLDANTLNANMNQIMSPILDLSFNFVKGIPEVIASLIFTIITAYVLIDDISIFNKLIKNLNNSRLYDYYQFLKKEMKVILKGWLRTQLVVMIIVFFILLIGLFIIKVKHIIMISLLIAIIDALPIFGSGFVLWPWTLVLLMRRSFFEAFVLLVTYLAIQFVRSIIQNKMMSEELNLNPIYTIISLFLGYKLFGVVGVIFSLPIAMLILSFYKFGTFDNLFYNIKQLSIKIKNYK